MGGGGEHGVHVVLLPGRHALSAHAALALGGVLAGAGALDIAPLRHGKDGLLLLNQILDIDFIGHVLNLRDPLVAKLVPDGDQLVLEHAPQLLLAGKKLVVVGDFLLQLLVLRLQLFPVQPLQTAQLHLQNGLGLHLVQAEALHQALLGVVIAGADDVDDLVDVVLGHQQTL